MGHVEASAGSGAADTRSRAVGSGRYSSPRHRLPFDSKSKRSKWVGCREGQWAWHIPLATS